MAEHKLKTWPGYFEELLARAKTFEVSLDDRGFAVGDVLILQEFIPETKFYTNRELRRVVTHKMAGGKMGIDLGYCILSLANTGND